MAFFAKVHHVHSILMVLLQLLLQTEYVDRDPGIVSVPTIHKA